MNNKQSSGRAADVMWMRKQGARLRSSDTPKSMPHGLKIANKSLWYRRQVFFNVEYKINWACILICLKREKIDTMGEAKNSATDKYAKKKIVAERALKWKKNEVFKSI